MTSPKTSFSLFVFNMARGFENVCESMFCDVKPPKKEQELFTKTKNGDNKMERVLEVLKISLVEDA